MMGSLNGPTGYVLLDVGSSASFAGDMNGDGYGDFVSGDNDFNSIVVTLGPDVLSSLPDFFWTQESILLGFSVSGAGDVNGDGYSDVIVGAPRHDNGSTDEGRAVLYLGSAAGLGTSPAWTMESDRAGALFGTAVTSAGDVNGDGYSDVIVGEPSEVGPRAHLYLGSASGLGQAAWYAQSGQSSQFGASVACVGDVNGDGYSDVMIGEALGDFGQTDEGAATTYLGSGGRGGWIRGICLAGFSPVGRSGGSHRS